MGYTYRKLTAVMGHLGKSRFEKMKNVYTYYNRIARRRRRDFNFTPTKIVHDKQIFLKLGNLLLNINFYLIETTSIDSSNTVFHINIIFVFYS